MGRELHRSADQQTKVMAEFKFPCPRCGQKIQCDELWSGHKIQCPSCQTELVVPQDAATDAPPPIPPPQPAPAPRLAIAQAKPQASAPPTQSPPRTALPRRPLASAKAAKAGGTTKLLKIGAVIIVVAVGGYFGFDLVSSWRDKANDPDRRGAARSGTSAPKATPASLPGAVPAAAQEGQTPAQVAEKELPMVPAVWTLDLAKAKIPDGKANGTISGASFVVESARVDPVGTAQVLSLRQGSGVSADREILVYLHLNAGETLAGHTWSVTKEMKGTGVPPVLKRWKTDPKYAPRQMAFAAGYAMKLEFGPMGDGMIPGKIFLALPDAEQSVVAGAFKAVIGLTAASSQPVVNPVPTAAPAPARDAAFEQRYGIKR